MVTYNIHMLFPVYDMSSVIHGDGYTFASNFD